MRGKWILPVVMTSVLVSGCAQKEEFQSLVTLETPKVMASSVTVHRNLIDKVEQPTETGQKQEEESIYIEETTTPAPTEKQEEPTLDEVQQVVLEEQKRIVTELFTKLEADLKAFAQEQMAIQGDALFEETNRQALQPMVKDIALQTVTPAFYDKYLTEMHMILTCYCDAEPMYRLPNFRLKAETDFIAKNGFGIKTMTNGSFLSDRQVQKMTVYVTRIDDQWYLDDLEVQPTPVKVTVKEATRDLQGLGYTDVAFVKEVEEEQAYEFQVVSPTGEVMTFTYYYYLGSA